MKDILEEILAHKRAELEQEKQLLPPQQLYADVEKMLESGNQTPADGQEGGRHLPERRSMCASLAASRSGIIAEFKRRSPSKGWIRQDGQPTVIPPAYARAGAAALSILTDKDYFGGHPDFIRQARPRVDIPILRKEFIIDEYQIFQARLLGADAVLLIAAALTEARCAELVGVAHRLGLEALLEIHGEGELDYAATQPDMLGVNNRHLGTFRTDVENSFRIASRLPSGLLLVSESGISSPQTVRELRQAGFCGFLIGETFMRQPDPGLALQAFIREVER